MDLLSQIAIGISIAFSLEALVYCTIGVLLGVLIGVLPGFGPVAAISLLLPITFYLSPAIALIMLAGVYYGSNYGGSTAAILLNLPGTAASAVTCLDGYPLARQGKAGVALFITTIASFVGSFLCIFLVGSFAPFLAEFALNFSAVEYTSIVVVGLVAAATIGTGSILKSLAAVTVGLLLGVVGTDINSGLYRLTFGMRELNEGVNLVALAMGIFGVSELIANLVNPDRKAERPARVTLRSLLPSRDELKRSIPPMFRGTGIGAGFGLLPGTGTAISSFVAYGIERRVSRNGRKFGTGQVEGVAAPEAANNAASLSAFIPTLTLGIPGDAVMAIMLGALLIHGVVPGPFLINDTPEIFWALIVSFLIGNVILVILNPMLIGLWVRILSVPFDWLFPIVLALICIGAYSVSMMPFHVMTVVFFGLVGYGMLVLGFQAAPLLLGFILGPILEENLRRALLLSRGDWYVFIDRPISLSFLALALGLLLWSQFQRKTN